MATKIAGKTQGANFVRFNFVDGAEQIVYLNDLPEDMVQRAAVHGLAQKLGDSYSGAESLATAKEAFYASLASIEQGSWNRAGGGSTGGLWVEALAEATGKEYALCLAKWNEMDEATRKATKKHPTVKLAHAKMQLQRAEAIAADAPKLEL